MPLLLLAALLCHATVDSSPDTAPGLLQVSAPYSHIRALGPDTWAVDRVLLDVYLGSPGGLAIARRVRDREGQVLGFALTGIIEDSPLHQAGLRNGDVLRSSNDRSLRTTAQAWSAVRELRRARQVRLDVLRRGRPLHLHYVIE